MPKIEFCSNLLESNAGEIVDRLKASLGLSTDAELASYLGKLKQSITKARKLVPMKWVVFVQSKTGMSFDWYLTGQGARLIEKAREDDPTKHPAYVGGQGGPVVMTITGQGSANKAKEVPTQAGKDPTTEKLLNMTAIVLGSGTSHSAALKSNIESFYEAVEDKKIVGGLTVRVDHLETKVQGLEGGLEEKKAQGNQKRRKRG